MGCGASRSVSTGETDDNLITHGNVSTTQIRDIAPAEVRDTGAHPPPRLPCIRPDRKALWTSGEDDVSPPGTVPDSISHDSEVDTESSLIRKHPPRRPQRLEEQPIAVLSANILGTRGSASESRIKVA